MEDKKFSVHIFLINITSRKFWVWIFSTVLVGYILLKNGEHSYFYPLIIIWGIISVIYLIGDPIEKGIGLMFENAKLTAELKAGAQANINTDTAKAIGAAIKDGGRNE